MKTDRRTALRAFMETRTKSRERPEVVVTRNKDLVQPVADAGYPLIASLINDYLGDGEPTPQTMVELCREVQMLAIEHEMAYRFRERARRHENAPPPATGNGAE
jgi:hypothetical protein